MHCCVVVNLKTEINDEDNDNNVHDHDHDNDNDAENVDINQLCQHVVLLTF